MITIRLDIGGILRFRMVDSGGAAVTGLLDGDFTSRRYVTETDTWGDLSGTITEGEAGWYSIPVTAGEADVFGQAVAYFSDGTNESHVTFMIDDLQDLAGNASNAANAASAVSGQVRQSLIVGGGPVIIVTGTTDTVLQLNGGVVAPLAEELLGATVVPYLTSTPSFRPSRVVSVNAGADTVTIDPPMTTALVDADEVLFFRTVPTLLDHPDGVDTGFSHARALRKTLSAAMAKNSGAVAGQAGTQVFRNPSDTADEFSSTYDVNGNRTGITQHD